MRESSNGSRGVSTPPAPQRPVDLAKLRSRQISHDIHHQLSTISVLTTILSTASDIGDEGRARARLILSEIAWLEELQLAYDECLLGSARLSGHVPASGIRLDAIAAEVVTTVKLATTTSIDLYAVEVTAATERLAVWRALRNVLQNAVRAAGPAGTVRVGIAAVGRWAVARVEDSGPGFGDVLPPPSSLGLGIVQDLSTGWGGGLEIQRSSLGGGCVTLRMPNGAIPADGTSA